MIKDQRHVVSVRQLPNYIPGQHILKHQQGSLIFQPIPTPTRIVRNVLSHSSNNAGDPLKSDVLIPVLPTQNPKQPLRRKPPGAARIFSLHHQFATMVPRRPDEKLNIRGISHTLESILERNTTFRGIAQYGGKSTTGKNSLRIALPPQASESRSTGVNSSSRNVKEEDVRKKLGEVVERAKGIFREYRTREEKLVKRNEELRACIAELKKKIGEKVQS